MNVPNQNFNFKPVEEKYIHKIISNLNVKMRHVLIIYQRNYLISSFPIGSTITNLTTKTFETSKIPKKNAQILPLFKEKRSFE